MDKSWNTSPLYIIGGPDTKSIEEFIEFLLESSRPLTTNLGFKVFEDKLKTRPVAMTKTEFSKVITNEKFGSGFEFEGSAMLRFGASSPKLHRIIIKYSGKTQNGRLYYII